MFQNCESLNELSLTNFNTKNVKDMSYLFSNCKSLEYLDINNLGLKPQRHNVAQLLPLHSLALRLFFTISSWVS